MTIFHVIAIVLTGLFVLYSDEQGLMWVLGKKEKLNIKRIEILHAIVGVGISLIILTGGLLVIPELSYFLTDPTFIVKMGFVLVLIVNAFFIGELSNVATRLSFRELPVKQKLPLMISGAVSVIGWGGALICGLVLG